jgi:Protein of unknown function (DUF3710)
LNIQVGSTDVLRRRRRENVAQPDPEGPEPGRERLDDLDGGSQLAAGPWDVADDFPEGERIDCGSLLIPVREGFDVQINIAEEQGSWVAVVNGESGMQLQAFAAPRSGGLWDEVRNEIAANIAESGGTCTQREGASGAELQAVVPVAAEDDPALAGQPQPVRFLGFDGPRWFLRGVVSGPASTSQAAGAEFDELFADVVVVRGDYPAPPREQLEIRLPEEARQALDEQLAREEQQGWELPDSLARGPEISETR